MRSYVISLERTPARLERFVAVNRDKGCDFEVFAAVDGRAVSPETAVADGVLVAKVRGYTPGGIGNAMSHRALWRRAAEGGEALAIFEDDVVLRQDAGAQIGRILRSLPADWDIVMLGYNTDTLLELQMSPGCELRASFSVHNPTDDQMNAFAQGSGPVGVFRMNHAFGVGAYLISAAGARALGELCFPMNDRMFFIAGLDAWFQPFGIDGMLNNVFRQRQAYACFPPLAWSKNDAASSTVQTR